MCFHCLLHYIHSPHHLHSFIHPGSIIKPSRLSKAVRSTNRMAKLFVFC
jgi:hypothetical protein